MRQKDLTNRPALSAREAEVLHWMGEGKTNREIGEVLGIAHGTVRKHAEKIFKKLGVENRLLAAMQARRAQEWKSGQRSLS